MKKDFKTYIKGESTLGHLCLFLTIILIMLYAMIIKIYWILPTGIWAITYIITLDYLLWKMDK